jgi:hypothetical protein
MELPARPAPVSTSIRTTSDVTTATADRNTNFSTNRATEASPKMPLLAVVHRGSLAFPDRFIYGSDTIVSQISISLREVVHPIMGHYISDRSKPHFSVCSASALRDAARVQHTNVRQAVAADNLFQ